MNITEITIAEVHKAFLAGALNCSQLVQAYIQVKPSSNRSQTDRNASICTNEFEGPAYSAAQPSTYS